MTESIGTELPRASDAQIEDAVQHADPLALRGLLYQLTGDEGVTAFETTTAFTGFGRIRKIAREEDEACLRRAAGEFLKAYRDSGAGQIEILDERLRSSVNLTVGEELEGDALELCIEDLALDPWGRSLEWHRPPEPQRLQGFSVTVIGAGLGGLGAAVMLKHAGIPYTVLEKNTGVGGTWHENRYPGARVDTPSRAYTNTFGVNFPYANPYCDWTVNKRYFDWVADTYELRNEIGFGKEVRSLAWDENASMWQISVEGPEGQELVRSNAVITAVGFLNRPKLPEIEGMAEFEGSSWHTARWPEHVDLEGKRIAVIGTGCSGFQTIPELALCTGHVVVFQRTPQWLFGVPGYRSPFPPQVKWLDRNFPYYSNYLRIRTLGARNEFARMTDIDPEFDDPHTLNEFNRKLREASLTFLQRKLGEPELVAKMTPEHPPWSARPVLVDSEFSVLDVIQRDNVTLVTDGIRRINRTGIEACDGTQYDVDVIVYATGFHATKYLYPMRITGRGGKTIEQVWKEGGARAYRFCMVPGFPNLWSIYGPNTNFGLFPSTFHELVTRYALQCMEYLLLEGKNEIEAREDAYWRFSKALDDRNACKVWSDPRGRNYLWSEEHGRSEVMCPYSGREIWSFLRYPDFAELETR